MKIIAVIIPVHNKLEYTTKCLKWLYDSINNISQPQIIKLILVDDGSGDGTAGWVATHYPDVIILKGDGNLWWSGAINLGAKHALNVLKCDYVLLWNNDIKPHIDYFRNLQNIINDRHSAEKTIIGSKIYFMNRPNMILAMGGVFNRRTGEKTLIGINQTDHSQYEKILSADWCSGMGTLIHKSIVDKIGFWDEKTFPQYCGDGDYTLRAQKHGISLLIYPNLKIYDDTSNSGIVHNNKFRLLIMSLFDLRSANNIMKQIQFYRRHSESPLAYLGLLMRYARYIGGFFKWKFLGTFGIKRKPSESLRVE